MSSINKVFILGRCGKDPEIRHTQGGDVIGAFSVATSTYSSKSGDKKEFTEWHRCVAFGKAAEVVQSYVKKGTQVHVEGSMRSTKWTDKNGQERTGMEIVVGRLTLLGKPSQSDDAPAPQMPFEASDIPF